MTTNTQTSTAATRMAVQAYQLRHVTDTITKLVPGSHAYAEFLAGYHGEAIRLIADAHQRDCTATHECATCDAIRVGLTILGADLLATRRLEGQQ